MIVLKIIGLVVGGGLTGLGVLMLFSRPDPSTTYAGERLFDNIVAGVIAVPALLIGVPLLGLCVWALAK